jgi:hypothetical protein
MKPQDGSPRSRFRRPLRRPLRAGSHGFVEESVPPQSLMLVLCALRVCAPTKDVSRTPVTLCSAAQMGRAWRVSQGLSLRAFATVATRRRGENKSLTLQRPQARPARFLPRGGTDTKPLGATRPARGLKRSAPRCSSPRRSSFTLSREAQLCSARVLSIAASRGRGSLRPDGL